MNKKYLVLFVVVLALNDVVLALVLSQSSIFSLPSTQTATDKADLFQLRLEGMGVTVFHTTNGTSFGNYTAVTKTTFLSDLVTCSSAIQAAPDSLAASVIRIGNSFYLTEYTKPPSKLVILLSVSCAPS